MARIGAAPSVADERPPGGHRHTGGQDTRSRRPGPTSAAGTAGAVPCHAEQPGARPPAVTVHVHPATGARWYDTDHLPLSAAVPSSSPGASLPPRATQSTCPCPTCNRAAQPSMRPGRPPYRRPGPRRSCRTPRHYHPVVPSVPAGGIRRDWRTAADPVDGQPLGTGHLCPRCQPYLPRFGVISCHCTPGPLRRAQATSSRLS